LSVHRALVAVFAGHLSGAADSAAFVTSVAWPVTL
jgi:hypothetical protein